MLRSSHTHSASSTLYILADIVNVLNNVNVKTYFIYVCYIAIFLLADQVKSRSSSLTAANEAQPEALLCVGFGFVFSQIDTVDMWAVERSILSLEMYRSSLL